MDGLVGGSVALIVAAGRGHRVGTPLPKQYLSLGGHAVLHHTVSAFTRHAAIDAVCVVIHADDRVLYEEALADLPSAYTAKLLPPAMGGATRQESVRNGLEFLAGAETVLIHDGARPFVSADVIDRTLAALDEADGAIASLPVSDTLKRAAPDRAHIETTVARDGLWRAQTPQTFRYAAILKAHHEAIGGAFTDDASIAEHAGLRVALTAGSEDNLKITTADDLTRAERILSERKQAAPLPFETRAGQGFDVHRFGPGDHLMICGVKVVHEMGVQSHSDGDVGLHALVDAMLGALAEGDIGSHFPPSDPQWRNADSALFIEHANRLLSERGGELVNVDITVICERPKIGPHRDAMIARLGALLGLPAERISVKATTTEMLGFTGRREGIAAQAIVTLRLPPETPRAL